MRYRKLRIAWSVGWGVVAVLLCVLWIRSYSMWDQIVGNIYDVKIGCVSVPGVIAIGVGIEEGEPWMRFSGTAEEWRKFYTSSSSDWYLRVQENSIDFHTPYWLPLIVFGVLATAPWLQWRFSLRTLLIATTLVAVALGLIVWISR